MVNQINVFSSTLVMYFQINIYLYSNEFQSSKFNVVGSGYNMYDIDKIDDIDIFDSDIDDINNVETDLDIILGFLGSRDQIWEFSAKCRKK